MASTSPLLLLAVALLSGVVLSAVSERLRVPWITGCIAAGVLLGPDVLGVLSRPMLSELGGFLQASLAVIAFNIGSRLTGARMRAIGVSIFVLAVAQLLAPLVAVFGAEMAAGLQWQTALLVAAVAPVTAPTTTYAIIRQHNASGPFAGRALGILAINDAATIMLFSIVSAAVTAWLQAHSAGAAIDAAIRAALANEAWSLAAGLALGASYLAMRGMILDGRPGCRERLRALFYALLLLAVGLAAVFGLSHLLVPLSMGVVMANGSTEEGRRETQDAVAAIEQPLYMIFFVLAGARLPIADAAKGFMLLAAATYVFVRFAGKYLAIYAAALALRLDAPTRNYLGLCFPGQGGTAMGLVLACAASPAVRALPPAHAALVDLAISVVLMGVLLSEIFAPAVVDYAVRRGCAADPQKSMALAG